MSTSIIPPLAASLIKDRSPILGDPPLAVSCDFLLVLALAVDVCVGEAVGVRPNMGGFCANAARAGQIKIIAAKAVATALLFIKNLSFISFLVVSAESKNPALGIRALSLGWT